MMQICKINIFQTKKVAKNDKIQRYIRWINEIIQSFFQIVSLTCLGCHHLIFF